MQENFFYPGDPPSTSDQDQPIAFFSDFWQCFEYFQLFKGEKSLFSPNPIGGPVSKKNHLCFFHQIIRRGGSHPLLVSLACSSTRSPTQNIPRHAPRISLFLLFDLPLSLPLSVVLPRHFSFFLKNRLVSSQNLSKPHGEAWIQHMTLVDKVH